MRRDGGLPGGADRASRLAELWRKPWGQADKPPRAGGVGREGQGSPRRIKLRSGHGKSSRRRGKGRGSLTAPSDEAALGADRTGWRCRRSAQPAWNRWAGRMRCVLPSGRRRPSHHDRRWFVRVALGRTRCRNQHEHRLQASAGRGNCRSRNMRVVLGFRKKAGSVRQAAPPGLRLIVRAAASSRQA